MTREQFTKIANDPKNWKKTHKKSYEVYVCKPHMGTKCSNFLEGTDYMTNEKTQFIMSGTLGENWTVSMETLMSAYRFADGTPITEDAIVRRSNSNGEMDWTKIRTYVNPGRTLFALRIPKEIHNFPVIDAWGNRLLANRTGVKHGLGDFLVCSSYINNGKEEPDICKAWVVNGEIFPATYDLRAFPNMFNTVAIKLAPVPTKIFIEKYTKDSAKDIIADKVLTELGCFEHSIKTIQNTKQSRSVSLDGNTFELVLETIGNDKIRICILDTANNGLTEVASWNEDISYLLKYDNGVKGIKNLALKIHNIISGPNNKDDIYARAATELGGEYGTVYGDDARTALKNADISSNIKKNAELLANMFRKVADKLNWKVLVEEVDADEAWWRVVVDRDGANGMWTVEFDCSRSGDAHFLEDFCEDVEQLDIDVKDINSVKSAITKMNKIFDNYS